MRASQQGCPFTKHCYLFSVMSISRTLVRHVLLGSAPLNEGILKEDNHMPILPIMTCPKHVLELILLLISWCWKTMATSSNLTSYNPKPTSPNYYKQCTVALFTFLFSFTFWQGGERESWRPLRQVRKTEILIEQTSVAVEVSESFLLLFVWILIIFIEDFPSNKSH